MYKFWSSRRDVMVKYILLFEQLDQTGPTGFETGFEDRSDRSSQHCYFLVRTQLESWDSLRLFGQRSEAIWCWMQLAATEQFSVESLARAKIKAENPSRPIDALPLPPAAFAGLARQPPRDPCDGSSRTCLGGPCRAEQLRHLKLYAN